MKIKTDNYEIYKGDCLEVMKDIPDKSVDMVLCDLPYGTLGKKSKSSKWDIIIPFDKLWEQYKRIIKEDGVIALTSSQPFTSKIIMSNIDMFRHEWIWQKDKSGNFMNCKSEPMKVHESVVIFGFKKGTYNPKMELRKKENKRKNKPRMNTSNIINQHEFFTEKSRGNDDYKYPTSVKFFNSVRNGLHPTQKPVELLSYLIETYTNEGETVLDNCMGSGSTGVACVNTNRKFIGIELDDKYFEISKNRLNEAVEKKEELLKVFDKSN